MSQWSKQWQNQNNCLMSYVMSEQPNDVIEKLSRSGVGDKSILGLKVTLRERVAVECRIDEIIVIVANKLRRL